MKRGRRSDVVSYRSVECHGVLQDRKRRERQISGRPPEYASKVAARAAANRRQRDAHVAAGLVQRSVWLSRENWDHLRNLRRNTETSDAAVLDRIIRETMGQ